MRQRRRHGAFGTFAAIGVLAFAHAAAAQLVPPAPPKTPPAEYVPPPPATPVPTPPARPDPDVDTPLPTLVKRGEDGKVVRLGVLPEQAAVEAMTFDEATRRRITTAISEYQSDMDARVIANPGRLVELIRTRDKIASLSTLEELRAANESVGELRPGSLLEHLQKRGAINPRQKRRAEQVVQEYTRAVNEDVTNEAGPGNIEKIVTLGGRRIFMEMSAEAVRSLDRQLAKVEPNMETIISGLSLTPEQKTQVNMLMGPASRNDLPEDRRLIVRRTNLRAMWLEVLNDEQRASVLKAVAPDLGVAKPTPAEPAKSGG